MHYSQVILTIFIVTAAVLVPRVVYLLIKTRAAAKQLRVLSEVRAWSSARWSALLGLVFRRYVRAGHADGR